MKLKIRRHIRSKKKRKETRMAGLQSRKNRSPFLLNYSCARDTGRARYGNVTYAAGISVRINQTDGTLRDS